MQINWWAISSQRLTPHVQERGAPVLVAGGLLVEFKTLPEKPGGDMNPAHNEQA